MQNLLIFHTNYHYIMNMKGVLIVKTVFRDQWWWQFYFLGCRILPIFKCFFDFNEIWFTWETWYPELIGDDKKFSEQPFTKWLPIFYWFIENVGFNTKFVNIKLEAQESLNRSPGLIYNEKFGQGFPYCNRFYRIFSDLQNFNVLIWTLKSEKLKKSVKTWQPFWKWPLGNFFYQHQSTQDTMFPI